eukprot:Nitzschia sp. Nitz4//scaffold116_size91068//10279//10674//NITZ4_004947-RA/size91068-processed-gene-0.51-mRNA-1//-1//CDS//3329533545//6284//frame0
MCKQVSGSTSVPFVSLPREPLYSSQLAKAPSIQSYRASNDATRYFCSICSSFVCMEYTHERDTTLWIPMGTLDAFVGQDDLNAIQDSHIFQEDEVDYEGALEKLPHCKFFGTYRNDSASGKPWEELQPFGE